MAELAELEIDGTVATLRLNRPAKRNALSIKLLDALLARLAELASRTDALVCVLSGAEPTFCAGMDLRAVLDEPGAPAKLLSRIAEATLAIRRLPMVTLARVNGAAIGGGCGLMATCDLAVTHPDARLGYPEVDLGVCPGVVAPWMVQLVGAGRARRILLQGGTMDGARAFELGMVSHCVAREELDATVDWICDRIGGAGPEALRATKGLLNEIEGERLEMLVRRGAEVSTRVIESPEARKKLASVLKV